MNTYTIALWAGSMIPIWLASRLARRFGGGYGMRGAWVGFAASMVPVIAVTVGDYQAGGRYAVMAVICLLFDLRTAHKGASNG